MYFVIFSLCSLYNWRYTKLGDLPHVNTWPEYCVENPGFFFDFQLIDVPDFNGVGESEPNPYFYQVCHKTIALRLVFLMHSKYKPMDHVSKSTK